MRRPDARRAVFLGLFVVAVGAFAAIVWRTGYNQALDQLARRGQADLTLAADRLTGQLQLYQQLAVLIADHPSLDGDDMAAKRAFLLQSADKTAALDIVLVDERGRVEVSATGSAPANLAGTEYFRRALHGALGEAHGTNSATGQRAYYFAAPRFDDRGQVIGALVVVANIEKVEAEWRGARPVVFFTDRSGEVFITNRSELLYWRRAPEGVGLIPPRGPAPRFETATTGPHEIWHENWSPYVPQAALHLSRELPRIGMRAEALIDVSAAQRIAWLQAAVVAAVCLAFGAILFVVTERRRTLALANTKLEGRVAERTAELSQANAALRREVAERSAAEAALKKAQDDLVQAGKLSALGQMSAGISHELNQPLMAIQQYAENGALFLERGKSGPAAQNLSRIGSMARRMARIIRNLRAFARQESEPVSRVDLVKVVDSALELSEARLRSDAVHVDWDRPTAPVWVTGGEVRLCQVVVNLIGNAVDAMAAHDVRRLDIGIRRDGARVELEVRDTGPGIEEPEKMFDPFYSTKIVGDSEGMGLGLSISYGLVQSFGGVIRGRNHPEGGAVMIVELVAADADEASARPEVA
ncbi:MAG: ATP-binding protein [Sediminimonas sp.]|uniref:sensor histidine kinase n=1 Tax=Sediminimonas sp. TaxID=2823379 RepID=UPI0028709325|nr:ATP-binding protein [Sediminimonas sp.]MDR9485505.1 ATP-binding protein [Sediminimonas sp.]